MPPFFRAGLPPPEVRGRCTVELTSGEVRAGQLVAISAERRVAELLPAATSAPISIRLADIHLLRLDVPRQLSLDEDALRQLGVQDSAVALETAFTVQFPDGQHLDGKTRGFVKNPEGVYLNLIVPGSSLTTACFVPSEQLADLRIGALIGETLSSRHAIDRKVIGDALDLQARLRSRRLGEYLTDYAVVSVDDLLRALDQQKRVPNIKLGEFLVREHLVTREQLDRALAVQRENRSRRLGDILVEMGVVSQREIQVSLSEKLGIPFVNVRDFAVDQQTLHSISSATAMAGQVLPLLHSADQLVVAVENPLSVDLRRVRFETGLNIVPVIANGADLRLRIAQEYGDSATGAAADGEYPGFDNEAEENLAELVSQVAREAPRMQGAPHADAAVTDSALVRLVHKIIVDAHAKGASDIHIESNPRNQETRVRFRRDGDLEDYLQLQPSFRNALVSRIKIMAGLDTSEHWHAQDGKIDFGRFGPVPIELRVAIIPTANGLQDVVMRILGGVDPLPLPELGLGERDLSVLREMVTHSYGLILVCGPTGSGKTTTLHSVLRHINRPDIKIWTAEDPIEITQHGLRQVQINAKTGWTFASAMRAFLRADPDVIMVGEMRDAETVKIGIEASLTGHLVLSTLHTNSAAESVVRLLELGMDPFNFSDALIGVLSQRLAHKLCMHCRKPRIISDAEIGQLAREYCVGTAERAADVIARWTHGGSAQVTLYEAQGCQVCRNGYHGRIGFYELLPATPKVKDLIRAHGTVPQIVAAAQEAGMRMLRQDGIDKVLAGIVDLPSARAAFT